MSELNQDKTSEALGNLESLILGSLNSNQDDPESDDFSRLQEMLVDPEVLRMRERMSRVEQHLPEVVRISKKLAQMEQQFDDVSDLKIQLQQLENKLKQLEGDMDKPKDIIKLILPIMSNMMNRQLNEFKQEILQAIVPIIKEYQEDQRKLSIRVVGVNPDNENHVQN